MAEKVLFESQSLYFSYNTAFGVYVSVDNPPPFSLVIGEKYKVLWDGTEYETTAIDTSGVMPGTVGAGNGAAWGYAGNNEPFVILYTAGSDISFISLTDTAPNTHTVSVYQTVEDVVVEDAVLYTVSSTSLKKVADAIREKSGSADPITFPDGFVQKISSISGGGGSSADVRYVTFMNGDTVLYKKPVAVGDDCVDVVVKGLISTPTKESDVQYNYTYYGWGATDNGAADANILKSITEDKTVYAIYTATARMYTITYYDSDGTTVLKTETLAYGTTPSYTPTKSGHSFTGWSPALATVTGDASYTASWIGKLLFASASWEDIARVAEAGEAANHFALRDIRTININGEDVEFFIAGFNHDTLQDGTTAGITILAKIDIPNTNVAYGGLTYGSVYKQFYESPVQTAVNNLFSTLDEDLQSVIKYTRKEYDEGKDCALSSSSIVTKSHRLWVPSIQELGKTASSTNTLGTKYSAVINNYPGCYKEYWYRNLQYYSTSSTRPLYRVYSSGQPTGMTSGTVGKALLIGFCI